jgi:hypothetical protein
MPGMYVWFGKQWCQRIPDSYSFFTGWFSIHLPEKPNGIKVKVDGDVLFTGTLLCLICFNKRKWFQITTQRRSDNWYRMIRFRRLRNAAWFRVDMWNNLQFCPNSRLYALCSALRSRFYPLLPERNVQRNPLYVKSRWFAWYVAFLRVRLVNVTWIDV